MLGVSSMKSSKFIAIFVLSVLISVSILQEISFAVESMGAVQTGEVLRPLPGGGYSRETTTTVHPSKYGAEHGAEAGALGGAVIGTWIGGPPGAAIGACIGAVFGGVAGWIFGPAD